MIKKIIIKNSLSPGDIIMLTAAIRDLKLKYGTEFEIKTDTSAQKLWDYNPYLNQNLDEEADDVKEINADYDLIHKSNQSPFHFIHGFIQDLNKKLDINIEPTIFKGDVHIGEEERGWYSQIYEIVGKDIPYWIIDAGYKNDYTAKQWESRRFQQIIDKFPQITFVQIGAKDNGHNHPELKGKNIINLIGKTDIRQLVRLMWNAYGVITPVSFPMHLSAAVEMHPRWKRKHRCVIVLAGGREPSHWEAYTNHQYIHKCGMLSCTEDGGCWKSRVVKLNDGDKQDESLCLNPTKTKSGQIIAKCMDMIYTDHISILIQQYLDNSKEDYAVQNP